MGHPKDMHKINQVVATERKMKYNIGIKFYMQMINKINYLSPDFLALIQVLICLLGRISCFIS